MWSSGETQPPQLISPSFPPIALNSALTRETSNFCIQSGTPCLYKYVPITISGPKGEAQVWAFIDDGSKASLIEKGLAEELGLSRPRCNIALRGYSGETTEQQSTRVCLPIGPYSAKGVYTVDNLKLPAQSFDANEFRARYPLLPEVDLPFCDNVVPRVLIGIPNNNLSRPHSAFSIGEDFSLIETCLGWVVYGGAPEDRDLTVYHANVAAVKTDVEVKEALKEYFDIDRIVLEATAHVTLSEEDKRAIDIMEATTKKVGDRYETGLLWKTDHPELPNSYGQATSRLGSMDKKFLKDKDLHKWLR